jgi:predicted MPP superfamily phosphohydrolase
MGYREIKLIQLVNKVKPDIILITADLVGKREGLRPLLDILSLLEPRLFTYVIFGDSDGAIEDLKASSVWSKAGVCVIENKAIALDFLNKKDSAFWLIGTTSAEELERLLQGIPRDKPVILLSHSPDIVKEAALRGVDLVLSGHTHGGQVGVDFIRRLFPYSVRSVYIAGLYQVGAALLYVNRGIGSEKELRFLCWPEVTVFSFFPEAAPTLPKALKQDERS